MIETNTKFSVIVRNGVPIVARETSDPRVAIKGWIDEADKINSGARIEWDCIRGLCGLNEKGEAVVSSIQLDPALPLDMVLANLCTKSEQDMIVFVHNAHLFMESGNQRALTIQSIWNLRDVFKARGSTCVLLSPLWKLPEELRHDIVMVSEPLPLADELEEVVKKTIKCASVEEKPANVKKAATGLLGCSAFAAEQFCAMSIRKSGIDLSEIARLRRSYIAQLPGVEIRDDDMSFSDVKGYKIVKELLQRKISGKRPPQIVVWWDEIEKAISASGSDLSGVTQDQIGVLLTWMQDRLNQNRLAAMLFVGFPGTGKSAIASATRNESKCECVRMDFGGMKDSLVGGSEARIRAALKGIDAIGGGQILVIATCNNAANLPSALTSRFALGTYFFDLPSAEEGAELWKIKKTKYGISPSEKVPESAGWTGREIQQCCFVSDDLGVSLIEASKYITPFVATGAVEIEALRNAASGRYLSASKQGLFRKEKEVTEGRRFAR